MSFPQPIQWTNNFNGEILTLATKGGKVLTGLYDPTISDLWMDSPVLSAQGKCKNYPGKGCVGINQNWSQTTINTVKGNWSTIQNSFSGLPFNGGGDCGLNNECVGTNDCFCQGCRNNNSCTDGKFNFTSCPPTCGITQTGPNQVGNVYWPGDITNEMTTGKKYPNAILGCGKDRSNPQTSSAVYALVAAEGINDNNVTLNASKQNGQPLTNDQAWISYDTAIECCISPGMAQCAGNTTAGPKSQYIATDGSGSCPTLMFEYCSYIAPQGWNDSKCVAYLTNDQITSNSSVVSAYMQQYIKANPYPGKGSSDGKKSADPFYTTFMPTVCNYPHIQQSGVCDPILNDLQGHGICAGKTRDDLTADETISILCGCHLDNSQYPYQGIAPPACDPACVWPNVIANGAWVQNGSYPCKETICVIDNVTISNASSQTGDITFNTICGQCSQDAQATCSTCYFSNIDINNINSETGGITFNTDCGTCYIIPPDGDPRDRQQVDCATFNPYPGGAGIWNWIKNNKIIVIGVSLGILLLLLVLVFGIYYYRKRRAAAKRASMVQTP